MSMYLQIHGQNDKQDPNEHTQWQESNAKSGGDFNVNHAGAIPTLPIIWLSQLQKVDSNNHTFKNTISSYK